MYQYFWLNLESLVDFVDDLFLLKFYKLLLNDFPEIVVIGLLIYVIYVCLWYYDSEILEISSRLVGLGSFIGDRFYFV